MIRFSAYAANKQVGPGMDGYGPIRFGLQSFDFQQLRHPFEFVNRVPCLGRMAKKRRRTRRKRRRRKERMMKMRRRKRSPRKKRRRRSRKNLKM